MAKMHQGQFEELLEFAMKLGELRQKISDQQLLDTCQQHLNAFVDHINDSGGKESLEPAPTPPPAVVEGPAAPPAGGTPPAQ